MNRSNNVPSPIDTATSTPKHIHEERYRRDHKQHTIEESEYKLKEHRDRDRDRDLVQYIHEHTHIYRRDRHRHREAQTTHPIPAQS